MRIKFVLPALLALPLSLLAFKPAETSSQGNFENMEKISYQSLQGKDAMLVGDGFIVHSSTVHKNAEATSLSTEAAVTSFADAKLNNASLEAFVQNHE